MHILSLLLLLHSLLPLSFRYTTGQLISTKTQIAFSSPTLRSVTSGWTRALHLNALPILNLKGHCYVHTFSFTEYPNQQKQYIIAITIISFVFCIAICIFSFFLLSLFHQAFSLTLISRSEPTKRWGVLSRVCQWPLDCRRGVQMGLLCFSGLQYWEVCCYYCYFVIQFKYAKSDVY